MLLVNSVHVNYACMSECGHVLCYIQVYVVRSEQDLISVIDEV